MVERKKEGGLKSAWELAMSRTGGEDDLVRNLSDAQKKGISEIDQAAKTKIAEIEIMTTARLSKAGTDEEAAGRITAEKIADIEKIQKQSERDKEKIRGSKEV